MLKKDINNFYVGELYLSKHFGNLLSGEITKEEKIERNRIQELKGTKAINVQQNSFNRFIDWNNRREYNAFLTLFYKKDEKHYICLHNGREYTNHQNEFYENLIPLKELLPKKSYKSLNQITIRESLVLFDELFNKTKMKKIMCNEENYPMQDFYVGNLNFCAEYDFDNPSERSKYVHLPQYIRLSKLNEVKTGSGFSIYENDGMYNYSVFRCLFLKNKNNSVYNLHDFQNYNEGTFEPKKFENINNGQSYYDYMIPFEEYLDKKEVNISCDEISIPKALTLYKR